MEEENQLKHEVFDEWALIDLNLGEESALIFENDQVNTEKSLLCDSHQQVIEEEEENTGKNGLMFSDISSRVTEEHHQDGNSDDNDSIEILELEESHKDSKSDELHNRLCILNRTGKEITKNSCHDELDDVKNFEECSFIGNKGELLCNCSECRLMPYGKGFTESDLFRRYLENPELTVQTHLSRLINSSNMSNYKLKSLAVSLLLGIFIAGIACLCMGYSLGLQNSMESLMQTIKILKMENAAMQAQLSQINAALIAREMDLHVKPNFGICSVGNWAGKRKTETVCENNCKREKIKRNSFKNPPSIGSAKPYEQLMFNNQSLDDPHENYDKNFLNGMIFYESQFPLLNTQGESSAQLNVSASKSNSTENEIVHSVSPHKFPRNEVMIDYFKIINEGNDIAKCVLDKNRSLVRGITFSEGSSIAIEKVPDLNQAKKRKIKESGEEISKTCDIKNNIVGKKKWFCQRERKQVAEKLIRQIKIKNPNGKRVPDGKRRKNKAEKTKWPRPTKKCAKKFIIHENEKNYRQQCIGSKKKKNYSGCHATASSHKFKRKFYNGNGDWVFKLADGREEARKRGKNAEWQFDRAKARAQIRRHDFRPK